MPPSKNTFSLGELFTVAEKKIPSELISKNAFNKIKKHADMLPGQITAFFGFECILDTPSTNADFLFCSTQLEGHSRILSGQHQSIKLPEFINQIPAWGTVQNFCVDWENPNSSLYQQVLNIWLEFDIAESAPPYEPSIFFGTQPPNNQNASLRRTIIIEALKRLVPEATVAQRGEMLDSVFNHLPSSAYIFQVGAMLARKSPAIRLCLRNIKNDRIVDTLVEMGWSGNADELSSLIEEISPLCDQIDIDIDVSDKIGEKIGLECSFGRDLNTLNLMKKFTSWLVEKKLTTHEKARALMDFNGLIHQDAEPDKWPEFLLKMAALSGNDSANHVACWLHHIKLVYLPDNALSAKAYLALSHDRIPRQMLRDHLKHTLM